MTSVRAWHTATLLLAGQLLVAGGRVAAGATASAELWDADTRTFTATAGMMTDSRSNHTATPLENGKVLMAGGQNNAGGNSLATAELYDPDSRTFKGTGSMAQMRTYHTSTLLLDGTVLVAGGTPSVWFPQTSDTAEIYNPTTGQFTTAGNMISARYNHTATVLKDGQVLIAGGFNNGPFAATELYNPVTKSFSSVGNLNVAAINHAATLLLGGQVLITGSGAASAELYDPKTRASR